MKSREGGGTGPIEELVYLSGGSRLLLEYINKAQSTPLRLKWGESHP